MFFQKDIETMNRKDLEKLQLERLRRMVDYCFNNVQFYNERLAKVGITSGDKIQYCLILERQSICHIELK